jgi:hypothetical protein
MGLADAPSVNLRAWLSGTSMTGSPSNSVHSRRKRAVAAKCGGPNCGLSGGSGAWQTADVSHTEDSGSLRPRSFTFSRL